MCGIFGWQLKKNKLLPFEKRMIIATTLGWLNETRGTDSYGWADTMSGARSRGVGRIAPHARHMAEWESLIGHTRKSTTGASTIENAHPFKIGAILGAHNGMIHNHEELNKARKAKGLKEYEVDSQHIFDALSKEWDISDLAGYGAVEWSDERNPGEIYLCRISASGELAVSQTPYGVFWSSDKDHLKEALLLAGVKHVPMEVKAEKVYFCEDGTFYLTKNELALKQYNYSSTPYGSRMTKQEHEQWWSDWVDAHEGGAEEVKTEGLLPFFRRLSKKDRKRLIKESNARLKRSGGGSSSDQKFAKYKDICSCGGWFGQHFKWCDNFHPVADKGDTICDICGSVDSPGRPNAHHFEWCDNHSQYGRNVLGFKSPGQLSAEAFKDQEELLKRLKSGQKPGDPPDPKPTPRLKVVKTEVVNGVQQLNGVIIGKKLCCPDCYTQVYDDRMCVNGHGKVFGSIDADPTG